MAFRPGKCLLPEILRERKIDPPLFYEKMGWSRQQYSAYCTGKRTMSVGTLKTVSEVFGLPMEDFYEWIEIPPSHRV
ncbi:helix-turn-helix transcriptional regulator [Paenibacillus sp. GYB003]|uniref:helix-turn-helix transcriptional regulator n=1 Tax=Paenibacillus sp. GYB003 TaxID=2994392 RepID=UPI003FA7A9ED